jgi:non-ribosomal peptide synthetase component F
MSAVGVHRVVERQVAALGDRIALTGAGGGLTYRDLNQRANIVARRLMACGLRRAARVTLKMERSPQLAVLMLAVLKAGAAYMWIDGEGGGRWPDGISISRRPLGEDEALIVVERAAILDVTGRPAPNLPIVTRPDDLACLVPQRNGLPGVLVPHATITALQSHPLPDRVAWSGDVAALDLWLPLMAGGTVIVGAATPQIAAA